MSKKLLIETRLNSLTLLESAGKEVHPGCLGTLKGPCADLENPTRNGNFYSRKLWENVFKDPLVVESLQDRVLIGELDHPGDRLETKATNAAIVMTDYKFNDSNGTLDGTFDILDTPNGRILRSLLDYGCKIGVSSRGEGDVVTKEGVDYVDEDNFDFVAFDAVVLPAVKKAKPSLQEGLDHEKSVSLKESLVKEIESSKTVAELDLIKKVIEATELPESDSLIESIKIKSSQLEGVTYSSDLIEDLEKLSNQVLILKEENKSLKEDIVTYKSRLEKSVKSSKRIKEDYNKTIRESQDRKSDLDKVSKNLGRIRIQYKSIQENLKKSQSKVERLQGDLRDTISSETNLKSKTEELKRSLKESQNQVRSKIFEIDNLKKEMTESKKSYESKIKSLEESLNNKTNLVESLQKEVNDYKNNCASMRKDFAEQVSRENGIDPKSILESVSYDTSTDEIRNLVESARDRMDRYSSLPMVNDPVLQNAQRVTTKSDSKMSEEDLRSYAFMTEALKHF